MLKGDLLFSGIIFLFSVFLFYVTGTFNDHAAYSKVGPAYWPRFLLVILLILSGFASLRTFLKISRERVWGDNMMALDSGKIRLFSGIFFIVFYIVLLQIVGFILATPLFLVAYMLLLGEKNWVWMVGTALGMTASIVLLFTKAMYVPIPRGQFFFRSFSLLFY